MKSTNLYEEQLSSWAMTLGRFVDDDGRVDFALLASNSSQLQSFVSAIAQVSPASHPHFFQNQAEVIAYHLNAYNALAMAGIIERGIPKHLNALWRRALFFRFRSVIIGGKKTNLYDYENKVIRPIGDARVHFALNCMVNDCPRLPRHVFTANTLEQCLHAAATEFFNKLKHINIDVQKKTVHLSGIMKFYTHDFVASDNRQDLIAYVNQYRRKAIPTGFRVHFLDYDWTINKA